jgi:hypothetical protein
MNVKSNYTLLNFYLLASQIYFFVDLFKYTYISGIL